MNIVTRTAAKQRSPDISKAIKIYNTYESYAEYKFGQNGMPKDFIINMERATTKTLLALRAKKPVRTPEIEVIEPKLPTELTEEIAKNPIRTRIFKRPNHYIRRGFVSPFEPNSHYGYESTQKDLQFITELKGPSFTIVEFEQLINLFEKEKIDVDGDPTELLKGKIDEILLTRNKEGLIKIYEYWKNLKKERGNKGLLRKYWEPPDMNNSDPKVVFRKCQEEKRNLRRNKKYTQEFFDKTLNFKNTLTNAKEIIQLCKKREEYKKYSTILLRVSLITKYGNYNEIDNYKDTINLIENIFAKKIKKPTIIKAIEDKPTGSQVKTIKAKVARTKKTVGTKAVNKAIARKAIGKIEDETNDNKSKTIVKAKSKNPKKNKETIRGSDDITISMNREKLLCNFCFTCLLSTVAQKFAGSIVCRLDKDKTQLRNLEDFINQRGNSVDLLNTRKRNEFTIGVRQRIDKYGKIVVDRRLSSARVLGYPFEPSWDDSFVPFGDYIRCGNLLIKRLENDSNPSERIIRKLQTSYYKDLYIFNDRDENPDNMEERYKYLIKGVKDFIKKRKKFSE